MDNNELLERAESLGACDPGLSWGASLPPGDTVAFPTTFDRDSANNVLEWFHERGGRKFVGWCVGRLITVGSLAEVVIPGADLHIANLRNADLSGADLSEVNLRFARLTGANLSGADLSYADLSFTNLRKVDLRGADLRGANLSGADLSHADLTEADLTGAQLAGASLPDGWRNVVEAH